MKSLMQLSDVSVRPRLLPFSADIEAGQQIHLIGANGAGKSTLLARVAGLLPGEGQVLLAGRSLAAYQPHQLARYRAYLPQQQSVISLMPVFQYLALHQPREADATAVANAVDYLCQQLSLMDKLSHPLTQLSGGEWQRVRLAAIFLQLWPTVNEDSKLLLLDEPTNSLDVAQQAALDRLIQEFCQARRSLIISSHDLNHSLQQANQVWLLAQGKLIAQGAAREVMQAEILGKVFNIDFEFQQVNQRDWLIIK